MFQWFYRRIGEAMIGQIEGWLQDPSNIEELTKLTDALVDRQLQRVYAKFSNMQAVPESPDVGGDLAKIVTSRGGISAKKLIGWGINAFLQGKLGQKQSSSGGLP